MQRAVSRVFDPNALAQATLPALLLLATACGRAGAPTAAVAPASTTPEITPADLRTRLHAFADDSMLGRRSGTEGNVKATDWLAAEAERIGLRPAGEDGTWFQTVPLVRRTLEPGSGLTVDGTTFTAWDDLIPRDQGKGTRSVDGAQAVFGGTWDADLITPEQAAGKLVVVAFPAVDGVPTGTVNRAQTTQRFHTAAGIVVATLDAVGPSDRHSLRDAGAQLEGTQGAETPA